MEKDVWSQQQSRGLGTSRSDVKCYGEVMLVDSGQDATVIGRGRSRGRWIDGQIDRQRVKALSVDI